MNVHTKWNCLIPILSSKLVVSCSPEKHFQTWNK